MVLVHRNNSKNAYEPPKCAGTELFFDILIFGSQKISKLLLILVLFIKKLFIFIYQCIVLVLFFYEKLDIIDFYIF